MCSQRLPENAPHVVTTVLVTESSYRASTRSSIKGKPSIPSIIRTVVVHLDMELKAPGIETAQYSRASSNLQGNEHRSPIEYPCPVPSSMPGGISHNVSHVCDVALSPTRAKGHVAERRAAAPRSPRRPLGRRCTYVLLYAVAQNS